MSQEIYLVEPLSTPAWKDAFPYTWSDYRVVTYNDVVLRDPNGRNGEWYAVISLPYESVEHEGFCVPAFEGDVERIEWEKSHRRNHARTF